MIYSRNEELIHLLKQELFKKIDYNNMDLGELVKYIEYQSEKYQTLIKVNQQDMEDLTHYYSNALKKQNEEYFNLVDELKREREENQVSLERMREIADRNYYEYEILLDAERKTKDTLINEYDKEIEELNKEIEQLEKMLDDKGE